MKTTMFPTFLSKLTMAGALALALSSFTTHAQAGAVLAPIGPTNDNGKVTVGYLKVYSSTQETQWGEGSYYYPHTAYWIYDSTGKRRTIDNHDSSIDGAPQTVSLVPGTYKVRAYSDDNGLVTVPVIIKLAQTTQVHLETGADNNERPAGQVIVGQVKVVKTQAPASQEKVASKD